MPARSKQAAYSYFLHHPMHASYLYGLFDDVGPLLLFHADGPNKLSFCIPPRSKAAPAALPSATTEMLDAMSSAEMSAPSAIPKGRMNMFATECSRPRQTNVAMGPQSAAICGPSLLLPEAHQPSNTISYYISGLGPNKRKVVGQPMKRLDNEKTREKYITNKRK
eukprot:1196047-Prorocentrum_minimum.AAC.1